MTKTKFDSFIGRSQFPKVDLRREDEILSFLLQGTGICTTYPIKG